MSRRNREKRAAKQKDRRRSARERQGTGWFVDDRVLGQEMLVDGIRLAATCRCGDADAHVTDLLAMSEPRPGELDVAVDTAVLELLGDLWKNGWTPLDLHEVGRRRLGKVESGYVDEVVVVESRRHADAAMHPRWRAGVAAVEAGVEVATETPHVRAWAARTGQSGAEALTTVVRALSELAGLPRMERILPLPGSRFAATASAGAVDEKMLAKVRALLAKAESTQFPDEAEALSAKAQELMSRHALHQAVADHDRGATQLASARRLWLDAPYAGAKAHLVDAVAAANRSRAVWAEHLGVVTVVGSESDLDIVELLSTSLLVQANRAMLATGRQTTRTGTSRTRSFRQSFLVAYATRIKERLTEADTVATREAAADVRLLPVLAARGRATEELTDQLFPHVVARSTAVSNAAGWGAGRAAADLALFDVHSAVAG